MTKKRTLSLPPWATDEDEPTLRKRTLEAVAANMLGFNISPAQEVLQHFAQLDPKKLPAVKSLAERTICVARQLSGIANLSFDDLLDDESLLAESVYHAREAIHWNLRTIPQRVLDRFHGDTDQFAKEDKPCDPDRLMDVRNAPDAHPHIDLRLADLNPSELEARASELLDALRSADISPALREQLVDVAFETAPDEVQAALSNGHQQQSVVVPADLSVKERIKLLAEHKDQVVAAKKAAQTDTFNEQLVYDLIRPLEGEVLPVPDGRRLAAQLQTLLDEVKYGFLCPHDDCAEKGRLQYYSSGPKDRASWVWRLRHSSGAHALDGQNFPTGLVLTPLRPFQPPKESVASH